MSRCSWGHCPLERIRDARFCQKHDDQMTKAQAGRQQRRAQRQVEIRRRWVERSMPGYEAELSRWQCIMDALDLLVALVSTDGVDRDERDLAGQAIVNLLGYRPKKPE